MHGKLKKKKEKKRKEKKKEKKRNFLISLFPAYFKYQSYYEVQN